MKEYHRNGVGCRRSQVDCSNRRAVLAGQDPRQAAEPGLVPASRRSRPSRLGGPRGSRRRRRASIRSLRGRRLVGRRGVARADRRVPTGQQRSGRARHQPYRVLRSTHVCPRHRRCRPTLFTPAPRSRPCPAAQPVDCVGCGAIAVVRRDDTVTVTLAGRCREVNGSALTLPR